MYLPAKFGASFQCVPILYQSQTIKVKTIQSTFSPDVICALNPQLGMVPYLVSYWLVSPM